MPLTTIWPGALKFAGDEHFALAASSHSFVDGGFVGAHDRDHAAGRRDGGLLHVLPAGGDELQARPRNRTTPARCSAVYSPRLRPA